MEGSGVSGGDYIHVVTWEVFGWRDKHKRKVAI